MNNFLIVVKTKHF